MAGACVGTLEAELKVESDDAGVRRSVMVDHTTSIYAGSQSWPLRMFYTKINEWFLKEWKSRQLDEYDVPAVTTTLNDAVTLFEQYAQLRIIATPSLLFPFQNGTQSGFEMCFAPCTLGAGSPRTQYKDV